MPMDAMGMPHGGGMAMGPPMQMGPPGPYFLGPQPMYAMGPGGPMMQGSQVMYATGPPMPPGSGYPPVGYPMMMHPSQVASPGGVRPYFQPGMPMAPMQPGPPPPMDMQQQQHRGPRGQRKDGGGFHGGGEHLSSRHSGEHARPPAGLQQESPSPPAQAGTEDAVVGE